MQCPVHGEVGSGVVQSWGSDVRVCNVGVGAGPASMVYTGHALGMAPAAPRGLQRCGLPLTETVNATVAKRMAATEEEFRRREREVRDELLARMATVGTTAEVVGVLADGSAALATYSFAGWPEAVKAAWLRLSSRGVFGPPTHDVVSCTARWSSEGNNANLLLSQAADRVAAWFAPGGGTFNFTEGTTSSTRYRGPIGTWILADGRVLARPRISRHAPNDGEIDAAWKYPYRRDPGSMLLAVPAGQDPLVREYRPRRWRSPEVEPAWIDTIAVTERNRSNEHKLIFDLASSLAALAVTVAT